MTPGSPNAHFGWTMALLETYAKKPRLGRLKRACLKIHEEFATLPISQLQSRAMEVRFKVRKARGARLWHEADSG